MSDVDAFTLLQDDHRKVEQLFEQFEQTGDYAVAMQICDEMTVHATVEEELVYGLYRSNVDSAGGTEAREEHQQIKDVITRIEALGPDGDGLAEVVQELKAAIEHHVQEEENEMFPRMLAAIPETVSLLGDDILFRKAQLLELRESDKASRLSPSVSGQKPNATTATPDHMA